MPKNYEVQQKLLGGHWENCNIVDGEPYVFDSKKEAEDGRSYHLASLQQAVDRGDLMDFNPDDYRVVAVPEKAYKHITIIGRVPEKDNVTFQYSDMTISAAKKQFNIDIYDGDEPGTRRATKNLWGVYSYIEAILTSSNPVRAHYEL